VHADKIESLNIQHSLREQSLLESLEERVSRVRMEYED